MTKSPHPSSVDKGELLPVTVEQVDREAAAKFLRGVYGQHGFDSLWAPTIERGDADWHAIVRLVVAVRQAHSLPGDVGMRGLLVEVQNDLINLIDPLPCASPVSCDARAILKKIDAALTPSALSGDAGEGESLRAALAGFGDDYMTSEKHHPGYVLIPTDQFERIRAALKPTGGNAK